ncbi:Swt1 family HEPN domain-containing protein [Oribacterium sp. P6A1]|uniref:Swt1 family HEPN domain-containing protein n=1 Tax=Oribacterium sp. P6A1 TaxID=1410612 RepID=UPI0005648272|nr:Swt1 family HEPN domain-containing protein [Oribacterium sp. P6A1]
MSRFEELYNSDPSEEEIRYLREEFEFGSFSTSWDDYYWGVKCLTVYDNDNFNPDLLIGMLNSAFEYGLTIDSDKSCFIGAHKILASIYLILKDYVKTVDILSSIINLSDVVPAWVYYDYVNAQNHTAAIEENLKEPHVFLENLHHTDNTVSNSEKRKTKIFKDFLVLAVDYISTHRVYQIELAPLKAAASDYGLLQTNEWSDFEKAVLSGIVPSSNEIEEELSIGKESKYDSINRSYQDLLDRLNMIQEELDEKNEELEDKNRSLSEALQLNTILEDRIKKYSVDILEYESTLKDKDTEINVLGDKLTNAIEGSNEKKRIEEELAVVRQQRAMMNDQIETIKNELSLSEKKLNDVNEELTRKANENKKLIAELSNYKNKQITFSSSVSADILAKCKAFEFITANKLADWLTRNLSYYNNWWQNFVIKKISYEQAERAIYYQDLHDFDLAALIRITVNNWELLRSDNFLTKTDETISRQMFNVRNNLSHNKAKPVIKESIIKDLQTLSDFLGMINAKAERYQVILYINEIAKMQIA